jgi:hypothetical protein
MKPGIEISGTVVQDSRSVGTVMLNKCPITPIVSYG